MTGSGTPMGNRATGPIVDRLQPAVLTVLVEVLPPRPPGGRHARHRRRERPCPCGVVMAEPGGAAGFRNRPPNGCGVAPMPASLPRPDTETVTSFAHVAERLGLPGPRGRAWRAPRAGPPSSWFGHGLGQHPRQRRESARVLRTARRSSITRFGGGTSVATRIKNGSASRPLRLDGQALPRSALRCQAAHAVAPSFTRGHAERRRSGACSQQALILDPRPLAPWKGRACGSCPEPGPVNAPAATQN
jgi:hypothetical protein